MKTTMLLNNKYCAICKPKNNAKASRITNTANAPPIAPNKTADNNIIKAATVDK